MAPSRNIFSRAFTLVEVLVVVIIIGMLAAIVVPNFGDAVGQARSSGATATLNCLRAAIANYRLQHGDQLPDLRTDWTALTETSTGSDGTTVGPYLMEGELRNPINALDAVVDGSSDAPSDCGWVYDYNNGAGSGRVWATGSDKRTRLSE